MKRLSALGLLGLMACSSAATTSPGDPSAPTRGGEDGGGAGSVGRDAGSATDGSSTGSPTSGDGAASTTDGSAGEATCVTDKDCTGGAPHDGRICASSGAESGHCIAGCHVDNDCAVGQRCDTSQTPHWSCVAADAGSGCPVLAYPSGIHVQTYPDAATTASYKNHLEAGQVAPACFVDTDHLDDPTTGKTYALSSKVSANHAFEDFVGTEIAQGFGHFVLLAPAAVVSLERFQTAVGTTVDVNSGFRSPKHQESVCNGLCGNPLGCAGTCANASRHMWGDAFDLPLAFYTKTDEDRACAAGFHFAYLESGTHLHIDQNPAYTTCVEQ